MPKSPRGLRMSSLNRLKWGDAIDGILPCRAWACTYADACRLHPYTRRYGYPAPGEPCALETLEHEEYVASAKETYARALEWLEQDEFTRIIERLSLLRLRWRRGSCRLSAEGPIKYVTLQNGAVVLRVPPTVARYWPRMQAELERLNDRLLTNPSDANDGQ